MSSSHVSPSISRSTNSNPYIAYFRDFFRRKAIDFRQKQRNLIVFRQLVDRRFQFFQLPSVPQNIFGGRFSCRSILLFAELSSNLVKPFLLSPFPAAFRNSDRTKQVSHPIRQNVPIEFVELLCRLFKRHPGTVFRKVLVMQTTETYRINIVFVVLTHLRESRFFCRVIQQIHKHNGNQCVSPPDCSHNYISRLQGKCETPTRHFCLTSHSASDEVKKVDTGQKANTE